MATRTPRPRLRPGPARAVACALLAGAGLLLAACTGPGVDDGASGRPSTGSTAGTGSDGTKDGSGGDGTTADDGTGTVDSETNAKVPARTPAPTTLPGLDGIRAADATTLTGALPATASARGGLVDGFPELLLPAGASFDIVSSSVSADGTRLQVGLEAGTAAPADDVRAAFTATLEPLGFAAQESPALPGDRATAYVHGGEGLVLTTRDRTGGGTELSVSGTLETAP